MLVHVSYRWHRLSWWFWPSGLGHWIDPWAIRVRNWPRTILSLSLYLLKSLRSITVSGLLKYTYSALLFTFLNLQPLLSSNNIFKFYFTFYFYFVINKINFTQLIWIWSPWFRSMFVFARTLSMCFENSRTFITTNPEVGRTALSWEYRRSQPTCRWIFSQINRARRHLISYAVLSKVSLKCAFFYKKQTISYSKSRYIN